MAQRSTSCLPMELPDWNQGIKHDAFFHESLEEAPAGTHTRPQPLPLALEVGKVRAGTIAAAKQTLQATSDSTSPEAFTAIPNPMNVALWLQRSMEEERAGRYEEAVQLLRDAIARGVSPAEPLARALDSVQKRMRNLDCPQVLSARQQQQQQQEEGNSEEESPVMSDIVNQSARKPTPNKTGLTGKAVRVPRQYAKTPGAAKSAQGVVPAPATNFTNVLKKLRFSTQKVPTDPVTHGPLTMASLRPHTTTKELRFGMSTSTDRTAATPLVAPSTGLGTAAARHVRFGAGTMSPEGHKPRRFSFRTPGAAIPEQEGSGEESDNVDDDDQVQGMSVNSRNAGRTPYSISDADLIRKYRSEDGAMDDSEEEEGQGFDAQSPAAWKRLSAETTVPNSIRMLSKKFPRMDEEETATETATEPASDEFTFVMPEPVDDSSPVVVPSPAGALPSLLASRMTPSGAVHLTPGLGLPLPLATLQSPSPAATYNYGEEEDMEAFVDVEEEEYEVFEDCNSDIDLSPRPGPAPLVLPTSPLSLDGVPRDMQGIPILTPGTVTCFRGSNDRPRDDGLAVELFRDFTTPPTAEEAVHPGGQADQGFQFFPIAGATTPVPEESSGTPDLHVKGAPDLEPEDEDEFDDADSDMEVACEELTAAPCSSHVVTAEALQAALAPLAATPEHQVAGEAVTSTPVPKSLAKSGLPVLGKPVRVPTPKPAAPAPTPPSATREIRSLMSGMTLGEGQMKKESTQQAQQEIGRVSMLSPARSTPKQKKEMGTDTVVTHVRRSARQQSVSPAPSVQSLLQDTEYAYAPNEAMTPPVRDSPTPSPIPSTGRPPSAEQQAALSVPIGHTKTTPTTTTPAPSYSTRSASKSRLAQESATQQHTTPAPAPGPTPGTTSTISRAAQRRKELHLTVPRTPTTPASLGGATTSLDPGAVVPQDSSPELGESPTGAEAARRRSVGSASLLASTLRKAHLEGTPGSTPGSVGPSGLKGIKAPRAGQRSNSSSPATPDGVGPCMSPTERNIREGLRSSKRKSMGQNSAKQDWKI